jgi:DNA-binding XRE family transcriptional regulator
MNNLLFLRLKRGLTHKELAAFLEISPDALCRIEGGWYGKPPEGWKSLCRLLSGKRGRSRVSWQRFLTLLLQGFDIVHGKVGDNEKTRSQVDDPCGQIKARLQAS